MKDLITSVLMILVMTVALGILYPLAVWGISQVIFPHQANGSLIVKDGKVIGSELIGQTFTSPGYFHSRPSAAGNGSPPRERPLLGSTPFPIPRSPKPRTSVRRGGRI